MEEFEMNEKNGIRKDTLRGFRTINLRHYGLGGPANDSVAGIRKAVTSNKLAAFRPYTICRFAFVFILGICIAASIVSAEDNQAVEVLNKRTNEAIRKISRKIEINIAPGSSGINSGLVIAYGHPLPKPYKFEHTGGRFYVNNVLAEPSLVAQLDLDERLKKETVLTPEEQQARQRNYDQIIDLIKSMRKLYFEKKEKEPSDQLHAEILAIVKANPLIKDARWFNDRSLWYKEKNSQYNVDNEMSFEEESHYSHRKPAKSPEQMSQERINEWENRLKRGGCLFFVSVGGWQGEPWNCGDLKNRVVQVMGQAGLSRDQKEDRLSKLFNGDHSAALDILLNYKESEWK
jgi:hypothetical protein